jgi:hypothetical protein
MRALRPFITVLLAAAATPLSAQNLISNPDFNTDVSGWQAGGGGAAPGLFPTVTLDMTEGSPAPPSGRFSAPVNSTMANSLCLPVNAAQRHDLSIAVKAALGPPSISVETYRDASCGFDFFVPGLVPGQFCSPADGNGWMRCSKANFALPAGTTHVRLSLGYGIATVFYVDNARFGPAGTVPVALQAFSVD